jgi:hypothetical protein
MVAKRNNQMEKVLTSVTKTMDKLEDEGDGGAKMATKLVQALITSKQEENKNKYSRMSGKMLRNHVTKRYERTLADKIVQYYETRTRDLY